MTPFDLTQRLYKAYKIGTFIEEQSNGCFHCIDKKPDNNGYARITIEGTHKWLHILALNITSIVVGETEKSKVLHSCDNPRCVNPSHLRYGTLSDNSKDRELRNRSNRSEGIAHMNCNLTVEQIHEIRNTSKRTSTTNLAKRYGLSIAATSKIRRRETYKSVL